MTMYALAEATAPETMVKLEALKVQKTHEIEQEKAKKLNEETMHIIRYLESVFSKNGGASTYIQVYGLTEEIERNLFPQYSFVRVKVNLYYVTRG